MSSVLEWFSVRKNLREEITPALVTARKARKVIINTGELVPGVVL
jgi:hypothetical protein